MARLGLAPRLRFAPFTNEDFAEGRKYCWQDCTEEQRRVIRGAVSPDVWDWVGPAELRQTVVQCMPGVLVEIQVYDTDRPTDKACKGTLCMEFS